MMIQSLRRVVGRTAVVSRTATIRRTTTLSRGGNNDEQQVDERPIDRRLTYNGQNQLARLQSSYTIQSRLAARVRRHLLREQKTAEMDNVRTLRDRRRIADEAREE